MLGVAEGRGDNRCLSPSVSLVLKGAVDEAGTTRGETRQLDAGP